MPHPSSQERASTLRRLKLRGVDYQPSSKAVSHHYVREQLLPTPIENGSFSCHYSQYEESYRNAKGKTPYPVDEATVQKRYFSTLIRKRKFAPKLVCNHGSCLPTKRLHYIIAISYALIIAMIPECSTRVPAIKLAVAVTVVAEDQDTENNTEMDDIKEDNVVDGSTPKQAEAVKSDPRNTHLPQSIGKATLVGAKLRGGLDEGDDESSLLVNYTGASSEIHDNPIPDHIRSPNADELEGSNVEVESPRNSKPPLTGCHWGSAGCNKGTKIPVRQNAATNASLSQTTGQGPASSLDDSPSPSSSSLAGSTTAAIEARVMEARGGNRKPKNNVFSSSSISSDSTNASGDDSNDASDSHTYMPPQGFRLTARIVTSPSDGLAYFLDSSPSDTNNNEEVDWLMGIPYTYVECGPTIESTTEAFSITDMVARHFPAGAVPGHWVNLGGGVTIDSKSLAEGGESGPRYLNGNLHDGHPKLLVALSPIEITVSGNFEETRVFQPGDVLLLEDTLGKGHKMRAVPTTSRDDGDGKAKFGAYSQDMSVLMISLPHTVHYPLYDWNDPAYIKSKISEKIESSSSITPESPSSSAVYSGAQHSLFGLRPKQIRQANRPTDNFQINKPCPLEYDSAYSSLFKPIHTRRGRHRTRRGDPHWKKSSKSSIQTSPFDDIYHPPPGLTTYSRDDNSILLNFLPSLRRIMLVGLGLSLTSSFVYCVQLLYPPLLALWGGATVVLVGSVLNVAGMRFGYREWIAVWEEEWRCRREVKNHNKRRANIKKESLQESIVHKGIDDNEESKPDNIHPNQVSTMVERDVDEFNDRLDSESTHTAEN
ncbi:hypothetical protein ACHAXS_005785 [Conticribra weissflogii]